MRVEPRFAFGQNWRSFAETVGPTHITEAVRALREFLGDGALPGKRFLDLGCGSGIHSLAALRLGAAEVLAVDIDPDAVATTRALLSAGASGSNWSVVEADLFELDPSDVGEFDVVYAWGVLHHTGQLFRAIRHVSTLVKPVGLLAMALYRKTWLCPLWRLEKWWYCRASPRSQALVRWLYVRLFALRLFLTGRRLSTYVENYPAKRGMSFWHDVHDWLGGYPYESTTPQEVDALMCDLGFVLVRSSVRKGRVFGRDIGLFGSGCDEYLYQRIYTHGCGKTMP